MEANQRFDQMDEKLEILMDQVGHLTAGWVDLRLTVKRQAGTADRLLTEDLAGIKATTERQVVVAERQAETIDQQVDTGDRRVNIVETVLQQRKN